MRQAGVAYLAPSLMRRRPSFLSLAEILILIDTPPCNNHYYLSPVFVRITYCLVARLCQGLIPWVDHCLTNCFCVTCDVYTFLPKGDLPTNINASCASLARPSEFIYKSLVSLALILTARLQCKNHHHGPQPSTTPIRPTSSGTISRASTFAIRMPARRRVSD